MLHPRTGKLSRLTRSGSSLLSVLYLMLLSAPALAAERPNTSLPQPVRGSDGNKNPAPTPQPVRLPEGTRGPAPGQSVTNPTTSPVITPPAINPAVIINNQIQQQGVLQVPRLGEVNKYLTTTTQPSAGRSSDGRPRGVSISRGGEPQFIQFSPNIVIVLDDDGGINGQLSAASRGLLPGAARFGADGQTQVTLEPSDSDRSILVFKRTSDSETESATTDNETNNSVVLIDRTLPEDKTLIQTRQQFLFPYQVLLRVGADGALQSINPQ